MSEETSRLNRATNGQQINQPKTQAKLGKHPIACIVAGILLSLTGIGVFIGAPLIYIGTRGLSSRKATALALGANQANENKEKVQEENQVQEEKELKKGNDTRYQTQAQESSSSQANEVESSQSNRSTEANQNANSINTSPQPTSLTTNEAPTVTIQPGEGYENVANGVVDLIKDNPENIATCMANDGTYNFALNVDGTLPEGTTNNALIKSIDTAKNLTDDELKVVINGNANAKINSTQAWTDFPRNCQTINIYGTKLTYKDVNVKGAQNESYEDFMKRVADEIKHHEIQRLEKEESELTSDEEKQIEEKQIKFFRQIFKYPGQALSGGSATTYWQFFSHCEKENGLEDPLQLQQTKGSNYTISLTDNDTITVVSTYQAIIIDTADLSRIEQNMANFPNRLCIEEKIIATIPLSEGAKDNNSKFTVNKNATTFFMANTRYQQGGLHIGGRTKPVIAMECTGAQNGQPPTFTIKEPVEGSEEMKTVKKLQYRKNILGRAKWR